MLPQDILQQLKDLDKRVKALERVPQAPEIQLSNTATTTLTIASNDIAVIAMVLTNTSGLRLLGQPFVSVYMDSISVNNQVGAGTGDARLSSAITWTDWGETDDLNLYAFTKIINASSSSHTFIFKGNWRFVQANGVSS